MQKFRILGIVSGRAMGNAEIMLKECLMECEKLINCEVHIVRLRSLKIESCDGCLKCLDDLANEGQGKCAIEDDFEFLKGEILWSDAIVFSSACFCYVPSSDVFKILNRALGSGKSYREVCRMKRTPVGMIAVGGSDTVDFHLPMQNNAMNELCPGFELVDQFYANWIRGKGYISFQEHHLERARLLAKRMANKIMGYKVPPISTSIQKLNPMEYKDDVFVELEECPVCHSAVVEMKNEVFSNGQFRCAVCGNIGHVEHHGGKLKYVWDDDTIAHNRFQTEYDKQFVEKYIEAEKQCEGEKGTVKDFPVLTPEADYSSDKPLILAIVTGTSGGTSEILAKKALEAATEGGKYEGAIIRINELNIGFCTGCLVCKVNSRYKGLPDRCVRKDDDIWVIDRMLSAQSLIFSIDCIKGASYDKLYSLMQRFGFGEVAAKYPPRKRIWATMVSSFDGVTEGALYPIVHLYRVLFNEGPNVSKKYFDNIPLKGDIILRNEHVLNEAFDLGNRVKEATDLQTLNPKFADLLKHDKSVCPSCSLNLVELHKDMTVSCALCDAHGEFKHIFGENVIVWDDYSVKYSRTTMDGILLHFKHIDFSQTDDKSVLDNPNIIANKIQKYKDYNNIVQPNRKND